MVGWWDTDPVVKVEGAQGCGKDVVATAYVIPGQHTVVSVASWANATVTCNLSLDWAKIELDPKRVGKAVAPTIANPPPGGVFQNETSFAIEMGVLQNVTFTPAMAAGNGWLLVLQPQ